MIKLFNKMRKQLLDENKTGRYFKYAIGEIVLVMIGILLALQVNTWTKNRQLQKEELQVMKSLHKEVSKNLAKFDIAYAYHLNRLQSIEKIMSIEPRTFSMDSLGSLILSVSGSYTFDPFQGIYNSLINSGRVELISNDLLKERISGLQDLMIDYQEEEVAAKNFTTQNLHKYILSEATFDNYLKFRKSALVTKEEELRIKEKYIKLIESDIYEGQLIFLRGWMLSIFEEGPILREEMISIINLLELEIEKHN